MYWEFTKQQKSIKRRHLLGINHNSLVVALKTNIKDQKMIKRNNKKEQISYRCIADMYNFIYDATFFSILPVKNIKA